VQDDGVNEHGAGFASQGARFLVGRNLLSKARKNMGSNAPADCCTWRPNDADDFKVSRIGRSDSAECFR